MGVNVRCNFPYGTRIEDVAKVAAALLGHEPESNPMDNNPATYSRVPGWGLTSGGSQVTLAYIVLDVTTDNPAAKLIRKSDTDRYHLTYHFESKGGPAMLPACTEAKIALCVGLVQFFGGKVDFNDSDDKDINLRVAAKKDIDAENDPEWSFFQKRILAVKPLTQKDVDKYKKYSAY